MDPQQRLLLEAAWEAIEDAGQVLDLEGGSNTGVFVGISTTDYASLQSSPGECSAVDAYATTGSAISIAANRISYCLNFLGPSVAVDTACSSALVALHAACRSLRDGECSMAIAGGVSALLYANPFIAFSSMSMLSPDGRCKAFDASANGFVRGEGVGAILLKPLEAARADGDKIYAVISGTGVNQDGRSGGLTVPSFEAQKRLIETVCREAGVRPAEIQYAEAHGTGTAVGDPIEARALGVALGKDRTVGDECIIGSAKTNIGHLEAAAGIAGAIKVALMLKHRTIPPSLHFRTPNPEIDFAGLKLRVAQTLEAFPTRSPTLRACVNSFGFGGTNAHALLESLPEPVAFDEPLSPRMDRPHSLVLSARTRDALNAVAAQYSALLESDTPLENVCATAAIRRNHHRHRLSVVTRSRDEIVTALKAFARGESSAGVTAGEPLGEPCVVFVFSGQGPQWPQMGNQLFGKEPVFRAALEQCHEILSNLGGWSLLDELRASEEHSRLQQTAIAQPAICAVQIALAALWRSWGICPDAVVGHSVGEVAAAHEAGVLSLTDALTVIYHRGACMEHAPGSGRMLAAALTPAQARQIIVRYDGAVSVAAINGPASVALSGDAEAIEEIALSLELDGTFCRPVPVNYAFHSAQMDPIRPELIAALNGLTPASASLPIYSTVLGQRAEGRQFDSQYWWRNVREPVQFASAMEALLETGHNVFVEVAPHPVLSGTIRECAKSAKIAVVPSMRRKTDEQATIIDALGALHVHGVALDWTKFHGDRAAVSLPLYPWQRQRHWHEVTDWQKLRLHAPIHPLLTRRIDTAEPVWTLQLDPRAASYLKDHRVQGHLVFPGAAYVEMAFGAHRELFGGSACQLEEVEFHRAFFVPTGDEAPTVHLVHHPREMTFSIHSRLGEASSTWTRHASGKIRRDAAEVPVQPESRDSLLARCREEIEPAEFYAAVGKTGLEFGPAFRGIERAWRCAGEALSLVNLTELGADADRYLIHPTVLDACFQAVFATVVCDEEREAALFLPTQIDRIRLHRPAPARLWCHVRQTRQTARLLEADITACNEAGELVLEIRGFRCRAVEGRRTAGRNTEDLFYEQRWLLRPLSRPGTIPRAADFLGDTDKLAVLAYEEAERLNRELGIKERCTRGAEGVGRVCSTQVLNAFADLGWHPRTGERVSVASLTVRMRIVAKYERLLQRYLVLFEQDGLLRREGSDWVVAREPEKVDLNQEWRTLLRDFPGLLPQLLLAEQSGRSLPQVLRGEIDVSQVLGADEGIQNLEHLYASSDSAIVSNRVAQSTLELCVAALPAGRKLRILEIGAGTGGLTSHLLPILPPDRVEYCFTDLSPMFFARAEQWAHEYPFIEFRALDIEKDPVEQGFVEKSYDVVFASNALHATVDVRTALTNVRSLLTSRGLLFLVEIDRPNWFLDLVFGTSDGFSRFTDTDLRPDHALLGGAGWLRALRETSFEESVAVSDGDDSIERSQAIFLARAPALPAGTEITLNVPAGNAGTWLLLGEPNGIVGSLSTFIREQRGRAILARSGRSFHQNGPDEVEIASDDAEALTELLKQTGPCRGIVHLWSLEAAGAEEFTAAEIQAAQCRVSGSVVALSQALGRMENPSPLSIITRCAQPVQLDEAGLAMAQTPVFGVVRVITSEQPNLRCRLIDLGPDEPSDEAQMLFAELCNAEAEEEVALRGEARYVQRVAPRMLNQSDGVGPARVVKSHPCRIETPKPGVVDNLVLRAIERVPPGPGEVEIEVAAAGLNFRDVMKALGIYPTVDGEAGLLGDECSGTISALGADVTGFQIGDEVCAIVRGGFASHVVTPAAFVMRKPARFLMEEAATVLVTFLTAHYALHHLGRMRPGERVLIHAAAGGVGLSAVQLALNAGAKVFATAGNPEKRALLEKLGVQHVMNSRTLSFAEEIMSITAGSGVDLVLNSLAGDAIAKSLSVLAPYGRFLEIGKRDIYENSRIGLRPFRNNLSYFAIDLGGALKPEMVGNILNELRLQFESGRLHPLPYRTYSLGSYKNAFRCMAQGKHIGKIVISWRGEKARIGSAPVKGSIQLRSDATYLVAGGLGGFGLATAQWLVARGARHLVLTSRSGRIHDEARAVIADCEKLGAEIRVRASDVSSEDNVATLFGEIAATMPPLAGVMHTAMVLDDCLLADLNAERLHKVLAPKMAGSWNLHRHTRDLPLDFFVLYSSMSSVMGNPGQANYAAANTFLDALAHHRRALHLPGLAINWGALAEVGYVARHEQVRQHLARQGWHTISLREAFAALEILLQADIAQLSVVRIDVEQLGQALPVIMQSRRYSFLAREAPSQTGSHSEEGLSIRTSLASAAPADRLPMLEQFLAEQIGKVLRTNPASIERLKSLNEIGLDSLMAVELLNRIESQLGVSVPTAEVMSGPTVAKLAALLAGSFGGSAPPTESEEQENPVASDSAAEMRAAVQWDHEIDANLPAVSRASVMGPSAILLTGATGFLGAYLLRELLERTNADIYCLVRAADSETALNRIEENLNCYGQRRSGHAARIIPVTGDLEKARFGFSEKQFNALAQTIDVIHHCGALVRHLSPYASHETANVAGTREILRFASSVKLKPVHYVSTLAVFNLDGSPEDRVIHESDEPDDVASLMGGYAESKWVAEAVVRLAGAKGLPVTISRPGLITGDSVTGVSSPDDFIWRLVRDCIELGAAPDMPTPLYLTPVNYVAAGIAQLSIQPDSIGGIYHLVNPCSPTLRDILSFARSIGYPMREMPLAEWEKMAATARAGAVEANSLRPYLLLYPEAKKESLRNATRMPRFDCSAALAALTGSGIKCPPVDEAMLRLVFEQFVQSGSWPAPAADSSHRVWPHFCDN